MSAAFWNAPALMFCRSLHCDFAALLDSYPEMLPLGYSTMVVRSLSLRCFCSCILQCSTLRGQQRFWNTIHLCAWSTSSSALQCSAFPSYDDLQCHSALHMPRHDGLFCSSCMQHFCTALVVRLQPSHARPVSYLYGAHCLYSSSAVLQCFCEQKHPTVLVQGFRAVLYSVLALRFSSFVCQ